jgi:hypothetical protein
MKRTSVALTATLQRHDAAMTQTLTEIRRNASLFTKVIVGVKSTKLEYEVTRLLLASNPVAGPEIRIPNQNLQCAGGARDLGKPPPYSLLRARYTFLHLMLEDAELSFGNVAQGGMATMKGTSYSGLDVCQVKSQKQGEKEAKPDCGKSQHK